MYKIFMICMVVISLSEGTQNILMIMADDMRPELEPFRSSFGWEISPTNLHAPNIVRLAAKGTTFLKTYCQYSVCGPSRTSLLTGRRPDTTQVYSNNDYWRNMKSYPSNVNSFPEYLKSNGFTTTGMGKIFHGDYNNGLNGGYDYKSWSYEQGYSFYYPDTVGHWRHAYGQRHSYVAVENSETDLLNDRTTVNKAIATLEDFSNNNTTFFMGVGFKLPHLPWIMPKEYMDKFIGAGELPNNEVIPSNFSDYAFFNSNELTSYDDISQLGYTGERKDPTLTDIDPNYTKTLREAYYASVSYVDSLVGELLDTLESTGLNESTAILFMSDHGYSLGEHRMWNKNTNFEQTNHVPLIISSPQHSTNQGSTSEELVELADILPTVIELAGLHTVEKCDSDARVSSLKDVCREGMSLVPLLSSGTTWDKTAAFHQIKDGNSMGYSMYQKIGDTMYHFTVWVGYERKTKTVNWKRRAEKGRELYNLNKDPYENVNIAGHDTKLDQILYDNLKQGWSSYNI